MAPANSWLSSCFAPSHEVLRPCQSPVMPTKLLPFHHIDPPSDASLQPSQYLFETFNENDWLDVKAPIFYTEGGEEEENKAAREIVHVPTVHQAPAIPKYERFVDHRHSPLLRPASSSPSSFYEAGFKSVSANSGSESADSSSTKGNAVPEGDAPAYQPEPGDGFVFTGGPTGFRLPLSAQLSQRGGVSNAAAAVAAAAGTVKSKKTADTVLQRTSAYRGVTRHRWTGRFEAHLWDNSCRREGQSRKGRQGGYDKEEKAARAYDLAALKYWGGSATTNFPVSSYSKEMEEMKTMTKQEFVASLRRKSSGFSRGASVYRGVTRHHQQGRWQARIGRVAGNKDLYLGTFATEEEAAEAYDIAAIKFRGVNAVTNFEMGRYDLEAIAASVLPLGSAAKRLKHQQQVQQQPPLVEPQYLLPAGDGHSIPASLVGEAPTTAASTALFSRLVQLGASSCSSVESAVPLPGFYEGGLYAVNGSNNNGGASWNGTDSF
ncbi:hypothetical protein H6P81_020370 [Aristolochia fimbriata]|uniref:AP2/ERF domain-containing protein n=1 Tax=Aristolochia fimbriata TaxID=158543 RepID=A0AAV7DUB0_ARIFI|nr:hypothetical protein H6P81_020370 [Aristolochia fimbriata]